MSASSKSLARSAGQKQMGAGCLRLFFLPFFLVGVGLFYGLTIRPVWKIFDARHWRETPCVVESSRVVDHPGDDSTTFSVEVVYQYTCDDRPYTSRRYNFASGSSSGYKSKAAIVARYPPGRETVCFVNPNDPREAVLNRDWQAEMGIGALGLIFALAGGLGLAFAGRITGSRSLTPSTAPSNTGGPVVLAPKHTPLGKFVGILIGALAWNGFIGTFAYFLFFVEDRQTVPIFPKIIIGVLLFAGVFLLISAFTSFLALFNPRVQLTAQTTTVSLGGELQFSWKVTGRAGMLRKLRVVFEGREEATYRRGTTTSTDTKVFAEIPVFETTEREFLAQGTARVAVPANLMHTFEAGNNKVLWRLKVHGEIPRWPDVADEYPITVLPQPARA